MYMHKREKIKNLARLILCITAFCATVPVFAADNSCEDEESVVNPALALCSTHVYNIGQTQNPSGSADKETMKEVIALKTTIMTQQMYKQYEYLESMIKRFKTQLEKAVLTTKLQSAGAGTDSSSSSSSGGSFSVKNKNSYIVLDSAKDCNLESGTESVLQCVLSNVSMVLSAVDEGKNAEARRQLQKDIEVANQWGKTHGFSVPTSCNSMSGASAIRNCAYALRPAISNAIDEYKRKNRTITKE